jgi:hypothetical protein
MLSGRMGYDIRGGCILVTCRVRPQSHGNPRKSSTSAITVCKGDVMAGIVEDEPKTPMAGGNVEPNTEDESDMKDETNLGKAAITEVVYLNNAW